MLASEDSEDLKNGFSGHRRVRSAHRSNRDNKVKLLLKTKAKTRSVVWQRCSDEGSPALEGALQPSQGCKFYAVIEVAWLVEEKELV